MILLFPLRRRVCTHLDTFGRSKVGTSKVQSLIRDSLDHMAHRPNRYVHDSIEIAWKKTVPCRALLSYDSFVFCAQLWLWPCGAQGLWLPRKGWHQAMVKTRKGSSLRSSLIARCRSKTLRSGGPSKSALLVFMLRGRQKWNTTEQRRRRRRKRTKQDVKSQPH